MTVTTTGRDRPLPARAAAAVRAVDAANRLSRLLGTGSGTVAGGRAGLLVDPGLLVTLARGRAVALVTGTNGKTTVTRLLVAAVEGESGQPVATNQTGANMPAGHVAALVDAPHADAAVLEVDESYLGRVLEETRARVVVLLNLSRDQLDRIAEVRMLVDRWRSALAADHDARDVPVVIANADDPMVAWAALGAPRVRWVAAGQVWQDDAVGCPSCGGRIVFGAEAGWACDRCDFRRPEPEVWLEGDELVESNGARHRVTLGIPGRFNKDNAVMAVVTAQSLFAAAGDEQGGPSDLPPIDVLLAHVATVEEVAGRFSLVHRNGRPVRLVLAKNPAGWTALFDLLDEDGPGRSAVVAINARTADGLDPSWLWDVPFERLRDRAVVATGDRRLDLAVRLRYAEVDHRVVADPLAAIDEAAACATATERIEFLGNYTAFAELRRRL